MKLFDECAIERGFDTELDAAERPLPTRVPSTPRNMLDLVRSGVRSVVWATGFRPDYRFLDVPVFDPSGRLRHDGGVVASPGLYLMGGNFMRRRKSSFIHGAADDANELSFHLASHLASSSPFDRASAVYA